MGFTYIVNNGKSTEDVDDLFELFDYKVEGRLRWKQFLIAYAGILDIEAHTKSTFAFDLFDEDKSGKIEKNELAELLMASHMATSRKEIIKKAKFFMKKC